jgi:hypothetical protein
MADRRPFNVAGYGQLMKTDFSGAIFKRRETQREKLAATLRI